MKLNKKHNDSNKAKNQFLIYDKKTALRLSLIISVILILFMMVSYFYAQSRNIGRGTNLFEILSARSAVTFVFNTLMLFVFFLFEFWVMNNYRNPRKRFFMLVGGSFILFLILSPIFAQTQWMVFNDHLLRNIYLIVHFIKDLIMLVITWLFTALLYMWNMNQESLMENQKLSLENLQNRYDALKNQVDPHFLFNSLNTLNGLIGFDDEKAQEYLTELSSVFRYTMQNKPLIQLCDELKFAESYMYLMKIRYNDGLQIDYKADEKYMEYYILPFGLQMLIENAIKHNVISMKYPLHITIETTDNDTIRVKNSLRPKSDNSSSGIGLANLDERYKLVFNKGIEIMQDENSFMVEIPLFDEPKKIEYRTNESESSYCRR